MGSSRTPAENAALLAADRAKIARRESLKAQAGQNKSAGTGAYAPDSPRQVMVPGGHTIDLDTGTYADDGYTRAGYGASRAPRGKVVAQPNQSYERVTNPGASNSPNTPWSPGGRSNTNRGSAKRLR